MSALKRYAVNEVFASVQGEGYRAGTENVFLRFSGCNLRCSLDSDEELQQFDCDTEFVSHRLLSRDEIVEWIKEEARPSAIRWVIATGGEPMLQLDDALCEALHAADFLIAIETNGSRMVDCKVDWITVSPKVAEHCIRQRRAHEVKYVRGYGQALPRTVVKAEHYYVSPAFTGLVVEQRTVDWCKELIEGTQWKLSLQKHKLWNLR